MPITLAQITQNTASVTLNVGEDTLTVEYYPARLTEKTIASLGAMDKMNDEASIVAGFKSFNDALVHLVKSWDLYEDAEQTTLFPLEADRLGELPIYLRKAVMDAILSDLRPEAMQPQPKK